MSSFLVAISKPVGSPGEEPAEKLLVPSTWVPAVAPADAGSSFIPAPGLYSVFVRLDGEEAQIGALHFGLVDPLPLTPERIAAIRADPEASKIVRVEASCNSYSGRRCEALCSSRANPQMEAKGYVWYQALPDEFKCSCGVLALDLRVAKRNMHGLLGQSGIMDNKIRSVPLYERGVIDSVRIELGAVVGSDPKEEVIQRFFALNPIVLHMFYPQKLFPKAPILTRYKTDFAITTASRELILVELEPASCRLMKGDGGVASEITHAFDQVHDWLRVCDEQRSAVLECIGLRQEEVASIRGAIIAGRDNEYDAEQLRKLKAKDFGPIRFYTYDDVLGNLGALAHHLLRSTDRETD